MIKYVFLFSTIFLLSSCHVNKSIASNGTKYFEVINETYHLAMPKYAKKTKGVLVLFGGFGERAFDIKRELNILDLAMQNNLPVLYLNYSQKLWLEEEEKKDLAVLLSGICEENHLMDKSLFIGGHSSGGVMAFLISDYLKEHADFGLNVQGVFCTDSPIDLAELYRTAESNVEKNLSKSLVKEGRWLLSVLGDKFGSPDDHISNYESYSVYTLETNKIKNMEHLKNTKIRLYTEPDKEWWKVNHALEYERMNAYGIMKMSESLISYGFTGVEYIPTENKGYRANGTRHPHSWSIIDKENLLDWILK